jgi:UDP-N-acetylglucosamine diphosphorylase/glucosamine-1-phosphate N-acetyltransferase
LIDAGRPAVVRAGEQIAAAVTTAETCKAAKPTEGKTKAGATDPHAALSPKAEASAEAVTAHLAQLDLPPLDVRLQLFEYPHDVVRQHLATIGDHLADRIARGGYRQMADGVFLAPGATLGEYVVTDTQTGPIVLEAGANVGPYCFLSGPVHLGANSRVIEHAALKHAVALGHTTKIGGEIEASIIEPYSNKQHHGFLGHSYLGSWVNLGAGTCNSDLKNTYGPVNMEYRGRKVATGMQFVGAIIGDYSKTAINTGIFTGKVIGVGSMVYDQRAQLRQLRPAVRAGQRSPGRGAGGCPAADVRAAQCRAAAVRHPVAARHVRADRPRAATGRRAAVARAAIALGWTRLPLAEQPVRKA